MSTRVLSSSWRDEKGVKLFSFFKYDVLSAGVVSSRKWDFFTKILDVFPRGKKPGRMRKILSKRRLSEMGHE